MELTFLPGGEYIAFAFLVFVALGASMAVGSMFFAVFHGAKQWLFNHSPPGKKLQRGFSPTKITKSGKWPWYLTDKFPATVGILAGLAFFYTIMGPVLRGCGLWKG